MDCGQGCAYHMLWHGLELISVLGCTADDAGMSPLKLDDNASPHKGTSEDGVSTERGNGHGEGFTPSEPSSSSTQSVEGAGLEGATPLSRSPRFADADTSHDAGGMGLRSLSSDAPGAV